MSGIILEGYKHFLNDTIFSFQDLIGLIPQPPPPAEMQAKFTLPKNDPYARKYNEFIKKRKINNFEIGDYSLMTYCKSFHN